MKKRTVKKVEKFFIALDILQIIMSIMCVILNLIIIFVCILAKIYWVAGLLLVAILLLSYSSYVRIRKYKSHFGKRDRYEDFE